jgi:hypothetical protein
LKKLPKPDFILGPIVPPNIPLSATFDPIPDPRNFDPIPAVNPPNKADFVSIPDALPAAAVSSPFAIGPTPGIKLTATGATFFTTFFIFLNTFDKKPNC